MPISGKLKTESSAYSEEYSHTAEIARPDYYKVIFPTYQLQTEISATLRSGIMRITALKADSVYILITPNSDLGKGFIKIDREKGEISGYNPVHRIYQGWGNAAGFSGYFFIRIQRTIVKSGVFAGRKVSGEQSISNQRDIGVFAGFKLEKGEQLIITSGTSFTSIAAAKNNLEKEINNLDFDAVCALTNETCSKSLSQIKVTDDQEKRKKIFYTALYHAQQHPRLFNDVDGGYPQFAGNYQTQTTAGENY